MMKPSLSPMLKMIGRHLLSQPSQRSFTKTASVSNSGPHWFRSWWNLALLCFDNSCTPCLGGCVSPHENTQQILPVVLTHALCSRCICWFSCAVAFMCSARLANSQHLLVILLVFATFLQSQSPWSQVVA